MSRIVVAGTEGPLGQAVAARYAELGHEVVPVAITDSGVFEGAIASLGDRPIDLLILADDFHPAAMPAERVTRDGLRQGLLRLAFLPFRLAALLKPQLIAAGGKVVLLTRSMAIMTAPDPSGHYLERPFRAAAHQLWRSLAAEWPKDGVSCLLIAVDDPGAATELPVIITGARNGALVDGSGRELGW
jgi:NAD(P)-dependent dehydrogenase (short-subunit alcohol dehydrogenase family)